MHNRSELSKDGAKNFTVTPLVRGFFLLKIFAVFPYISSKSLGGSYEEMGSRVQPRSALRVNESKSTGALSALRGQNPQIVLQYTSTNEIFTFQMANTIQYSPRC